MPYEDKTYRFGDREISNDRLRRMQSGNNPRNEPVGHFTGRCDRCGSTDLWDDNLTYGCNRCGRIHVLN